MEKMYQDKKTGNCTLVNDGKYEGALAYHKRKQNENVPLILSHPTYDYIHALSIKIWDDIQTQKTNFDLIVGLSRGGLLPGVIISHQFDIPFKPLEYSSKKGQGGKQSLNNIPKWILHNKYNLKPTKVLLVDDIVDSGHTFKEIVDILKSQKFEVTTAALYHKESAIFAPDYVGHIIPKDFGWVVFPFEKEV
jgi:hypoxanthine phosphoribosyltransferase